jgi:hypothetical protein
MRQADTSAAQITNQRQPAKSILRFPHLIPPKVTSVPGKAICQFCLGTLIISDFMGVGASYLCFDGFTPAKVPF